MANNALNRLVKTYTYNGLNAATNTPLLRVECKKIKSCAVRMF